MKKIAQAIVSMGVVLAFSACSWEVPKSVSVKSQADYSFSLGTFEKELDNSMNMSSMMGNAGEGNDKIQTYDYFPGKQDKNTQHFLLEVQILEVPLVSASDAEDAFEAANTDSLTVGSGLNISMGANSTGKKGLDFNPSTMLAEMKEALGEDMAGKISFASVPMYLYCETVKGLNAKVDLRMFYSDSNNINTERDGTSEPILTDTTIKNIPLPVYSKEGETVITDLATIKYIGRVKKDENGDPIIVDGEPVMEPIDIKDRVNDTSDNIEENDQLSIEYTISDFSGTIKKSDAENGIYMKLYAVIDLPVKFEVLDEVKLDISEMTKGSGSEGSSSSSSSGDSSKSGNEEFSKYLEVIDSVTIKYVAYKLPFYSTSGMKLGIDMVGDGTNKYMQYAKIAIVDKNKNITDADKGVIELKQATIQKMKDISNFSPKIQLLMEKDSVFSLPREKAVEMNIEMGITTDGTVKVN